MPLTLLACQIEVPAMTHAYEKRAHVTRVANAIDIFLGTARADIVVLPELCSIDYSRQAFSQLDKLAEPLDGETYQTFAHLAERHGVYILFGMPRVEAGDFFITQALIAPDGKLAGHYDKIHIAQYGASMEKEFFTRGGHLFAFDIDGFRIAPIICYDIRVPELTRTLCLNHGAHLILHCGAYARDESFPSWHDFAVTRAMENQVYLLSLNRAGSFYGGSIFCPPWIDDDHRATVLPNEETFRLFEISTETLSQTRSRYPFLTDRLPDYRSLKMQ